MSRTAWLCAIGLVLASCNSDEDVAQSYENPAETGLEYDGAAQYQGTPAGTAPYAAASGQPEQGRTTMPQGTVHAKRVQIIDRQGFEKPIVASTVIVPVTWREQGGVFWNAQALCGSGYNFDFRVDAPDGRTGVHFFPMEYWQWNNTGSPVASGCPTAQINSIQQYLQSLVQRTRPGAQIKDFRPRPNIAKELENLNQVTPMPMGEIRAWVEAGEVLIAYQQNGIDMRETISAAAVFTLNRMQAPGMPMTEYFNGATLPGFAMRAPNGQLDFKLAEMIRKSAKANPAWTARITQHNAKITNMKVTAARDQSRMTAQYGEEIRQMHADSWRLQSESFDRNSRETSEWIRGVETYNDPYYGGTVQLDNTYEHAYQLNDGSYVLTDDPDFNPYRVFGQDAQRLEVTR